MQADIIEYAKYPTISSLSLCFHPLSSPPFFLMKFILAQGKIFFSTREKLGFINIWLHWEIHERLTIVSMDNGIPKKVFEHGIIWKEVMHEKAGLAEEFITECKQMSLEAES